MSEKRQEIGMKEKIMEVCSIPRDTVKGYPITTIIGYEEISICNYRGILEYNDSLIKVLTKIGQIRIEGMHLEIAYYTNEEMKIIGEIQKIEFLRMQK